MGRVIPREDDAGGNSSAQREEALATATELLAKLVSGLMLIAVVPPLFWLAATAYVARASIATDAEIVAKTETILLSGDWARRIFHVTYRYRPSDAASFAEGSHNLDVETYERLRVGQRVRVRYATSPLLRAWEGVGSYLDGSSPWVRTRFGPTPVRDLAVGGWVLAAVLAGLLALAARSVTVGVVAALLAGVAFPIVLLIAAALLGVPWLFWAAIRRQEQGYAWMLLGLIGATIGIVYWRIPHPEPMPEGSQQTTTAIVRQIKLVNQIWRGPDIGPTRAEGQAISHPFQMIDLEFTPAGATEPVHALDRIDADSLRGIAPGARVQVTHSSGDPRAARIVGAARTFDRTAWYSVMTTAGTIAMIATFILFPIASAIRRLADRLRQMALDVGSRELPAGREELLRRLRSRDRH